MYFINALKIENDFVLYFTEKVKSDHTYLGISTKFYSFPMTLPLYTTSQTRIKPLLGVFWTSQIALHETPYTKG